MIEDATVIDKRPTERSSPEAVLRDRQNLLVLKPPVDPATGLMVYNTPQAARYRAALRDIAKRYGDMQNFRDALEEFAAGPEPQLASAAAAGVPGQPGLANGSPAPNVMAGLMQFTQNMMGPSRPPAAAANVGPPAIIPSTR